MTINPRKYRRLIIFISILLCCTFTAIPAFAEKADAPSLIFTIERNGQDVTMSVTAGGCSSMSAAFFALKYDPVILTLCNEDGAPAQTSDCAAAADGFKLIDARFDPAAGYVGAELRAYPTAALVPENGKPLAVLHFRTTDSTSVYEKSISLCTIDTDRAFLGSFVTDYTAFGGALLMRDAERCSVNAGTLDVFFHYSGDVGTDDPADASGETLGTTAYNPFEHLDEPAPQAMSLVRIGGISRIETSVLSCQKGWYCSDNVVIANSNSYQDALSGVSLASAFDAPLLLSTDNAPASIMLAEIRRLGVQNVYIIGGYAAINLMTENFFRASGLTVCRICGKNRYETAVEVSRLLAAKRGGSNGEMFFLNSENYQDAPSVSVIASISGSPILYVPKSGSLPVAVTEFIVSSDCKNGTIIGGTGAVSEETETNLRTLGLNISRISGSDRFATALAVYGKYESLLTGKGVVLATADDFPDALLGAVLASKLHEPVIAAGKTINAPTRQWVLDRSPESAYVLGGRDAIPDATVQSILG